jgi:hypothetical protein
MNLTFASIGKEQLQNAAKRAGRKAQESGRGKNRLAMLREAATAKPEPPKAYLVCGCKVVDGYLRSQPDCPNPRHGNFKENLAFARKNMPVEGAGRDGRRKGQRSE